uniref:Uncharacterized protein n=1 Tax=viral metagenome TaxID=1070528 RepID=A0A6C0H5X8_9ZZZZ
MKKHYKKPITNNKKSGFVKRKTEDGLDNPKYVDVLSEDKPIANQKFGCFSFISPEKILENKELFYFSSFIKKWNFSKSVIIFDNFLHYISESYKIDYKSLADNFKDFLEEEKGKLNYPELWDDYKTYLDNNETYLQNEFNKRNNFTTSVRAIKCRGVYASEEEANFHAKILRESDPTFDILVGPVGVWLPWDPDAYKTGNVEYIEEELNQLMHEKIKNEELAKNAFDKRILDAKKKSMEDNKEKSEKYGNKISQTLDENGKLVGINNTQESKLSKQDSVAVNDIVNELFEGDDIVINKKNKN